MKQPVLHIVFLLPFLLCLACGTRYVPKPYGYCRISMPEHDYSVVQPQGLPLAFELNKAAHIERRDDPYWLDIVYPSLNAAIHCSYKPVNGHLRELGDDAQEFVFKHAGKASSIPEQGYYDEERRVFGVYYCLNGNTASPQQFYLTDSVNHFFRGSVYFNCVPNQDSLAPVISFFDEDVRHIIETLRWQ